MPIHAARDHPAGPMPSRPTRACGAPDAVAPRRRPAQGRPPQLAGQHRMARYDPQSIAGK
jgi:hypothetical protein